MVTMTRFIKWSRECIAISRKLKITSFAVSLLSWFIIVMSVRTAVQYEIGLSSQSWLVDSSSSQSNISRNWNSCHVHPTCGLVGDLISVLLAHSLQPATEMSILNFSIVINCKPINYSAASKWLKQRTKGWLKSSRNARILFKESDTSQLSL